MSFHQNQRGRLGVPWALTTLQPALPCQAAGDVQPSTHLGLSLFQADLMKPSLQMKHNFKDRHVVEGLGMMYACSCSLAAVSLITADANEMLTAYGDRESSHTLHQSTIYL